MEPSETPVCDRESSGLFHGVNMGKERGRVGDGAQGVATLAGVTNPV